MTEPAGDLGVSAPVDHRRGFAEIGVLDSEPLTVGSEQRAGSLERARILIKPDHARTRGEQGLGMPAPSDRRVQVDLAGIRSEELHRLSQEHWPMRELHGLLIACASPG